MKYKVGDTVTIRSKEWWNKQQKGRSKYCGKEAKILNVYKDKESNVYYDVDIDNGELLWIDEMFETEKYQVCLECGKKLGAEE